MTKTKIHKILTTLLFSILIVFSSKCQEYSIKIKIKNPTENVHIKLYKISEPFNIKALNSKDFIASAISLKNNEYIISGSVSKTSLYRLNILDDKEKYTHINNPLSSIYLSIRKGCNIYITLDSNSSFDDYTIVSNQTVNYELKKIFKINRSLLVERTYTLDQGYKSIIKNTKYPEVFYLAISDSISNNIKNLKKINEMPIIRSRIVNDFSDYNFSKQLLVFMVQDGSRSWFIYYTIISVLFILLFLFVLYRKIKKNTIIKKFNSLSQREKIILLGLSPNKTNKELSEELFIQYSTLKKHLANIYKKIKVNNKNQAIDFIKVFKSYKK